VSVAQLEGLVLLCKSSVPLREAFKSMQSESLYVFRRRKTNTSSSFAQEAGHHIVDGTNGLLTEALRLQNSCSKGPPFVMESMSDDRRASSERSHGTIELRIQSTGSNK
jgi:hypothetical protein